MKAKKESKLDIVPVPVTSVLSRKNADGSVAIMKLDDDQHFFTLTGIAAEAWTLMDGSTTVQQIQERLARKHNPPMARFETDMANLIAELKKEKLIHLV